MDACSEFAAKNDIIFDCEKSLGILFAPLGKKFYGTPQLTLISNKIDFVESVKYLGVHICNSLTDDDDIARQVQSLYCYANMLKHRFFRCTTTVTNLPFRAYCSLYRISINELNLNLTHQDLRPNQT